MQASAAKEVITMVKPNKQASIERRKKINAEKPKPKPAERQDSRKVHDTKGKNVHGRTF
jgi:hypothetical protein